MAGRLNLHQAAKRLGLKISELSREVKSERLKVVAENGSVEFEPSEVDAFLAANHEDRLEALKIYRALELELPAESEVITEEMIVEQLLSAGVKGYKRIHLDPIYKGFKLSLLHRKKETLEIMLMERFAKKVIAQCRVLVEGVPNAVGHKFIMKDVAEQGIQVSLYCLPTRTGDHVQIRWPNLDVEDGGRLARALRHQPHARAVLQRPGLMMIAGVLGPKSDHVRNYMALQMAKAGYMVVSIEHRPQAIEEALIQMPVLPDETAAACMGRALSLSPDLIVVDGLPNKDWLQQVLDASGSGLSVLAQGGGADVHACLSRLIEWTDGNAMLRRQLKAVMGWLHLPSLCASCRCAVEVPEERRQALGLGLDWVLYEQQGCERCSQGPQKPLSRFEITTASVLQEALSLEKTVPHPLSLKDLTGRCAWLRTQLQERLVAFSDAMRVFTEEPKPVPAQEASAASTVADVQPDAKVAPPAVDGSAPQATDSASAPPALEPDAGPVSAPRPLTDP